MIELIEYYKGNIQTKIDGVRSVIMSAKEFPDPLTGKTVKVNEYSSAGYPVIVQAAFNAVKDMRQRSDDMAKCAIPDTEKNPEQQITIAWQGQVFTPYSDMTGIPADVAAFCQAIWDNGGKEIYDSVQAKQPKQPEYETEEFTNYRRETRNGREVLVQFTDTRPKVEKVNVAVVDEDGKPVLDDTGMPVVVRESRRVLKKEVGRGPDDILQPRGQ